MSNILLGLSRVTRWCNRKYRKERVIQNCLGSSHIGGVENYDPLFNVKNRPPSSKDEQKKASRPWSCRCNLVMKYWVV